MGSHRHFQPHFPAEILEPFNVVAQHPDEFVGHLISLDWRRVCTAVRNQRLSLRPPVSIGQLLDTLERQGLPLSVSQLRPLADLM